MADCHLLNIFSNLGGIFFEQYSTEMAAVRAQPVQSFATWGQIYYCVSKCLCVKVRFCQKVLMFLS